MVIEKQQLTAEDLLQLPTGMGERYELIEGELRVMSPAGPIHGKVANEISRQISNYVVEHRLGETFTAETGYYIQRKPDTVRAPDFSFISNDRLPETGLPERGYMPVMPDFAVEVVSPGDGAEAIEEKNLLWLTVGVRLLWVVYPSTRRVFAYTTPDNVTIYGEDDQITCGDILPGFQTSVKSFFAR